MPPTCHEVITRAFSAAALESSLTQMIAAYPNLRCMLSPAVDALAGIRAELEDILCELQSQDYPVGGEGRERRIRSLKALLAAVVAIEGELEDIDVELDEVVGKVLNEEAGVLGGYLGDIIGGGGVNLI